MDSIALWFSSDEDEDEDEIEKPNLSRFRQIIREQSNPLCLSDSEFVRNFRLSKEAFTYLLEELKVHTKSTSHKSRAVSLELKLAATLWLLAEGDCQKKTGNDFTLGLAQSTVSTIFKEIIDLLEATVYPMWVRGNLTEDEKAAIKINFFKKFGFPGVIGCIKGTHIKIVAPKKELQHLYYNKEGFYSMNAMIVCDHNMTIRWMDAGHPGSSNDAHVWDTSDLKGYLKSEFDSGDKNSWLLGDARYSLEPFLMTPFRSPDKESSQDAYNAIHTEACKIIARTVGVLKNRFRCLLGAQPLHYKPQKVTQIANVCAALHNICIYYKVPMDDFLEEELTESGGSQLVQITENSTAVNTRNTIMNKLERQRLKQQLC